MFSETVNLKLNSVRASEHARGIPTHVVEAARGKLVQLLQIEYPDLKADDVIFDAFKKVEWSDGSLGCPEEGVSYMERITPGYWVAFHIGEERFILHTNADGSRIVSPDFRG